MGRQPRDVEFAIERAIERHGEVGLQVAAYWRGGLTIDLWGGDTGLGSKVDGTTLFPVFSVSKAVTATALHIQADRGLIDYFAPIAQYWPEFGSHGKERARVYDVLTHRLGVPLMPSGVTPELMTDWDWMVARIADMHPLFEPGTRSAYLSYTFGWIIGELVQRTDPAQRSFRQFVQDEICAPLDIDALWFGIEDEVEPRIARLIDLPPLPPGDPGVPPGSVKRLAIPSSVATTQEVYARPDVRRAVLPGAGAIMNARSMARFFAMLAEGGALNGTRILSRERVEMFKVQGPPCDYDLVVGRPHRITVGGFHLAGHPMMAPAGSSPSVFGHMGSGGTVGWADPSSRLAVGITHNRMFDIETDDDNPFRDIGLAIRRHLGIPDL